MIQIAAKVQKGQASREEMQAAVDLASARIKLMKTQAHLAGLNAALTGSGAASKASQGIKSSHIDSHSIGNNVAAAAAVSNSLLEVDSSDPPYSLLEVDSSDPPYSLLEVDSSDPPYSLLEVDAAPSSDITPRSEKAIHEKTDGDDLFLFQKAAEVRRSNDSRCVRKMNCTLFPEAPICRNAAYQMSKNRIKMIFGFVVVLLTNL